MKIKHLSHSLEIVLPDNIYEAYKYCKNLWTNSSEHIAYRFPFKTIQISKDKYVPILDFDHYYYIEHPTQYLVEISQ